LQLITKQVVKTFLSALPLEIDAQVGSTSICPVS